MINFANVKEWRIPYNGSLADVIRVTDTNNTRVIWEKPSSLSEPFYVENISNKNETLNIVKSKDTAHTLTIEYSTDKTTWQTLGTTSTTALTYTLQVGDKVYLRCDADTGWGSNESGTYSNRINGCSKVGGNIMSLLYGSNFTGNETTFRDSTQQTFCNLFNSNTNLVNAQELLLPATTLVRGCYYLMFNGCTSLTTAPQLPATTLTSNCYNSMFIGCTSLTTAPQLPATTLARSCYYYMFRGCTSLTTAPALPATTLAKTCYYSMFYGCTSLNTIECLATDISATNATSTWLYNVSATGMFTKAAGVTWPDGQNGIPSGWTVVEQ